MSVVLRDRPWSAVVADMIDGFVAVNDNASPRLRDDLWAAAERIDAAASSPRVAPLAAIPPAA